MSTFLFEQTVFGPIISRRLGLSLGINLLPNDSKLCSFDCIYCECGWNPEKGTVKAILPTREEVKKMLREKLTDLKAESRFPDVITFAGNGEPTMHPDFASIIEDTLMLKNEICPNARIAVLSNSTMLHKPSVVDALKKVDQNILKLDSGLLSTIIKLNKPTGNYDLGKIIAQLKEFQGNLIIQTMFTRGEVDGTMIDNTLEEDVCSWQKTIETIKPKMVMIYTIDRDTPFDGLKKIPKSELESIAQRIKLLGIVIQVSA